jgi:glycosyltransferase involved in cell wall biosynthesis
MLRVLHVSQPTDAGVARVVADLVADQVAAGLDVATACPPDGPLAGRARRLGAAVLRWPASREPGPALAPEAVALARLVARHRPDLVHLHSSKAGLAGRLAVRGRVPTVFQPHAWSFLAAPGLMRPACVAWERYATRWTHRVVYVSDRERRDGERLGIRAAGVVVPNGVDLAEFAAGDRAGRDRARAALGLGPGPVAVCVGRLCRQKGQDLLLAAWPRVQAAVPEARLVLVGDGPARAELAAAAPPGVVLAGPAADPRPWYAAADVVALPSRWEGMALVQLEAMASGRCVVATDTGGARELLPDPAAVVPVEDVAALADALSTRLAEPSLAAAEGAAGRARACAEHDIRQVAPRVRQVYADLVGVRVGG